MKTIGNILWLIFGGLVCCISWYVLGALLCITIIGIPFGKQCFKFGKIMLWPMGSTVKSNFGAHPIMNIIWILLFGWEMAIGYLLSGVVMCITIIGIPFGLQWFKLMQLAFIPFGATITKQ